MVGRTRRKLDAATVGIDESQPKAATRLVQHMWFLNEADVRLFQQCGGTLYRLFIGQCIRNVVQTTPVTRVKTQDELFRRRTAKVDGIRIFADLIKAPDVRVKARVRF
jgi:hypothetical protein